MVTFFEINGAQMAMDTCAACGTQHSFELSIYNVALQRAGEVNIYCPYGHKWHYKPRKQIDEEAETRRERDQLWKDQSLPMPGRGVDAFSGFTLDVAQVWWGHKAEKRTWLYICGVEPFLIPLIPYCLGRGTHVIGQSKRLKERPEVTKAEREHTPMSFCKWLVDLAGRTSRREITA